MVLRMACCSSSSVTDSVSASSAIPEQAPSFSKKKGAAAELGGGVASGTGRTYCYGSHHRHPLEWWRKHAHRTCQWLDDRGLGSVPVQHRPRKCRQRRIPTCRRRTKPFCSGFSFLISTTRSSSTPSAVVQQLRNSKRFGDLQDEIFRLPSYTFAPSSYRYRS